MLTHQDKTERFRRSGCKVDELAAMTQHPASVEDFPLAKEVAKGVPIYDCHTLRQSITNGLLDKNVLMAEWVQVWQSGPGVLVLQGLYDDTAVIDSATACFQQLIASEKRAVVVPTILPNLAQMTVFGMRLKSCACCRQRILRIITVTRC